LCLPAKLTGAALAELFERLGQPLQAERLAALRERLDAAGRDHRVTFGEARPPYQSRFSERCKPVRKCMCFSRRFPLKH